MISSGRHITLRPYRTFKDEPEKNCEYIEAEINGFRMLYFQVLDKNRDPDTKKSTTGFANVRIITNAELHAWDRVQVKEIKGIRMARNKAYIDITIIETGEKYVRPVSIDGFEYEEEDF